MLGPSVAASLISSSVRALVAANYGKFDDRPTRIFNGTALLVSFVVKAYFSWSDKEKYQTNESTTEIQLREFGLSAVSQMAGHLAGVVALSILGKSLAWDYACAYTIYGGVISDVIILNMTLKS